MTAITSTRLIHDDGPDFWFEQQNDPVAVVGSGFTITKAEVHGGVTQQTFPRLVANFLTSQYMMGIQYGPSPYTPVPLNVDTIVDDNTFIFVETLPSNANSAAWSNEADTGGYLSQVNVQRQAFRQILVPPGESYEVWFSVGPNIDLSLLLGFRRFISVRLWVE